MLKNTNIGNRLFITFSLLIVIFLAVSTVTINKMQVLAEQTEKMYNHPYTVNDAVLNIEMNTVKIHRAMKDIALSTTKNKIGTYKAIVDNIERETYAYFEVVDKQFLGDKIMYQNALTYFRDWKPIRDEVIDLMLSGDSLSRIGAKDITRNKGANHIAKLADAIKKLKNFADSKATEFYKNSLETKSTATTTVIVILVISIILILIIAVAIIRSITNPLKEIVKLSEQLSKGDLTIKFPKGNKDETGLVLNSLEAIVEKFKDVITLVISSSESLLSSSLQLNNSSQLVSQGASEQASSNEELSATIEEISANVEQNTENAQQTEKIAIKAATDVKSGNEAFSQTIASLKTIANKISIISEIAFQTNILALNAAVEAARAGEHGRGFAVVAAEVRKLAERSQKAANEINTLSSSSVDIAENSGKLLSEIIPQIETTAQLVKEIAAASLEQNSGVSQVNTTIQQLNTQTQQNAATAEELSSNSEETSEQAENLRDAISFFKIE